MTNGGTYRLKNGFMIAALVAGIGAIVGGIWGAWHGMSAAYEVQRTAQSVGEGMILGFEGGAWTGAKIALLLGVVIAAVRQVRAEGLRGRETVRLGMEFVVTIAAFYVAYLGLTERLPWSFHAVRLLDGLAGAVLVALALFLSVASAQSIEPAFFVSRTFLLVNRIARKAYVVREFSSSWGLGMLKSAATGFVFFLIIGSMIAWFWEDLVGGADYLVAVVAWGGVAVALSMAGSSLVARLIDRGDPSPTSRRSVTIAGALWLAAAGAVVAGVAGASIRDRSITWRGQMTMHTTQSTCSTGTNFVLRGVVRSTLDMAIVQCGGCDCTGNVHLRARPGEALDVVVRSGDQIITEDVSVDRQLPASGFARFDFRGPRVTGTLALDPGAEWVHARAGLPTNGAAGSVLPASIELRTHVDRIYGPAFPRMRIRIETPNLMRRQFCDTSFRSPDCGLSVQDPSLRVGDEIHLVLEHAYCVLACTMVDRTYRVEGADSASDHYERRGIVTDLAIQVGDAGPLPHRAEVGATEAPDTETQAPLNSPAESDTIPAPAPAVRGSQATAAAEPTNAAPTTTLSVLRVAHASASSSYAVGRETHPPEHAFDGNPGTAWNDGVPGDGRGQWIEADFGRPVHLQRIRTATGWDHVSPRYGDLFTANDHFRHVRFEFDAGRTLERDVATDERELIVDGIDIETSRVRIVAADVWPGEHFQDVTVSDVVFEGHGGTQ